MAGTSLLRSGREVIILNHFPPLPWVEWGRERGHGCWERNLPIASPGVKGLARTRGQGKVRWPFLPSFTPSSHGTGAPEGPQGGGQLLQGSLPDPGWPKSNDVWTPPWQGWGWFWFSAFQDLNSKIAAWKSRALTTWLLPYYPQERQQGPNPLPLPSSTWLTVPPSGLCPGRALCQDFSRSCISSFNYPALLHSQFRCPIFPKSFLIFPGNGISAPTFNREREGERER